MIITPPRNHILLHTIITAARKSYYKYVTPLSLHDMLALSSRVNDDESKHFTLSMRNVAFTLPAVSKKSSAVGCVHTASVKTLQADKMVLLCPRWGINTKVSRVVTLCGLMDW
jgi:hypothetical protein